MREVSRPGYVRFFVVPPTGDEGDGFKVEWAMESAWRFLPVESCAAGWQLHPVDLAVNKVIAATSREEPRDYFDVLYAHDNILPLGPLVWAVPGKDPGLPPGVALDLLKRRPRFRREEFDLMQTVQPMDPVAFAAAWREAIAAAADFLAYAPASTAGNLFVDADGRFGQPARGDFSQWNLHPATLGGVLPTVRPA